MSVVKVSLAGAVGRLTAFIAVCVLAIIAISMIFAQLRFDEERVYSAEFQNVTGLKQNDFVRIAGVEVGKVKALAITSDDAGVTVQFSAADSVTVTDTTRAVIRYDNLTGDRYLELEQGAEEGKPLHAGQTIPVDRTQPALDFDALIGGFRPLFRALNPEQVNALTGQLIQAFEGQGATISSLMTQSGAFTNALADRDRLIGDVIISLNTVLGTVGKESEQVDTAVRALSELMDTLAARRSEFANGLARTSLSAGILRDFVEAIRPELPKVVGETDRAAGIVVADHEYFDDLLNTLPDAYRLLARQGLSGDYFSFYMCDVVLKLNGKGGQPVYVKAASQSTGRCSPK